MLKKPLSTWDFLDDLFDCFPVTRILLVVTTNLSISVLFRLMWQMVDNFYQLTNAKNTSNLINISHFRCKVCVLCFRSFSVILTTSHNQCKKNYHQTTSINKTQFASSTWQYIIKEMFQWSKNILFIFSFRL